MRRRSLGALSRQAHELGGIIAVGAPFAAEAADMDDFDMARAVPVGTPGFVNKLLVKYTDKISSLLDELVELPARCSPDRQGVQAANLLLRYCAASKAAHLLRILPPDIS